MEAVDNITAGGSFSDMVVLNYGDPAYNLRLDATPGLGNAEAIFLRIMAYLVFTEGVCIPARHILEGREMTRAVMWAAHLLQEGILVPTQRVDTPTFTDYVKQRNLPETANQGAHFLDANAKVVRRLRYHKLSSDYRSVLAADLARGGSFRHAVSGASRGRYALPLDQVHDEFEQQPTGTPDIFVSLVSRRAPELARLARRWAMARYYVTPVATGYDTANTRELPTSAARLLARGGVIQLPPRVTSSAAPVETISMRIRASLPTGVDLDAGHQQYCAAVLEVRRALPEARKVFTKICHQAELQEVSAEVDDLLARELARQARCRPGKDRTFALISGLLGSTLGGGLGLLAGGDVALGTTVGFAAGVGTNMASNEVQQWLGRKIERSQRPWLLAMDQLDGALPR